MIWGPDDGNNDFIFFYFGPAHTHLFRRWGRRSAPEVVETLLQPKGSLNPKGIAKKHNQRKMKFFGKLCEKIFIGSFEFPT